MSAYLPLASHSGWFEGDALLQSLGARLKALLIIEDELVVEPGAVAVRIAEGDISEQRFAPGAVPWPRNDVTKVGVFSAPDGVTMCMDWEPLLAASGLLFADGVRILAEPLKPKTRRELRARADAVAAHEAVVAAVPGPRTVREAMVKHWLIDCAAAAFEGSAVAVDGNAHAFLLAMNRAIGEISETAEVELRGPSSFRVVDVSAWPWDRVLSVRASEHGARLRHIVRKARSGELAAVDVQSAVDAVTGRTGEGPSLQVDLIHNAVPALLGMSLVGGPAIVYVLRPCAAA